MRVGLAHKGCIGKGVRTLLAERARVSVRDTPRAEQATRTGRFCKGDDWHGYLLSFEAREQARGGVRCGKCRFDCVMRISSKVSEAG
jgi:hypothetical protein